LAFRAAFALFVTGLIIGLDVWMAFPVCHFVSRLMLRSAVLWGMRSMAAPIC
jgi:hypothetical protein